MKLETNLSSGGNSSETTGTRSGSRSSEVKRSCSPVQNELWPEDKVRDVGQQAAEAERERNRGEELAQLLAVVLAVDETSQIQALSRTQPVLPMGLGYVEGVTTIMLAMARPRCLRR